MNTTKICCAVSIRDASTNTNNENTQTPTANNNKTGSKNILHEKKTTRQQTKNKINASNHNNIIKNYKPSKTTITQQDCLKQQKREKHMRRATKGR